MKTEKEIRAELNRLKEQETKGFLEDSEQMVSGYARRKVIEAFEWILDEK